MDYDPGWTNTADNLLSRSFEDNFSYPPPFYPEYCTRNVTNSFTDPSCYSSDECFGLSYFSPESHIPNDVSQYMRYHSYHPRFSPFKGMNYNREDSSRFYTYDGHYGSNIKENHLCSKQSGRLQSQLYKGNCSGKTNHFKANIQKKRQKLPRTRNIVPKEKFSFQNIDNNNQSKFETSNVLNCIPIIKTEDENRCNKLPVINEGNYETLTHEETIETNIVKPKTSTSNLTGVDDINFISYAANNIGINSVNQNNPLLNNFSNVSEDVSNIDLIFNNKIIDNDLINCPLDSNLDSSACKVLHLTLPENIYSNTVIKQENLENTETESYLYKPIFEGKDENGEDIILFAPVDMPQRENEVNTAMDKDNSEAPNEQECISDFVKHNALKNESSSFFQSLAVPINEANNEYGENMFFSHMDDYASEETVISSTNVKTTNPEKENDENTHGISEATVRPNTEDNCTKSDFLSDPSTSTGSGNLSTCINNSAASERCIVNNILSQPSTSNEYENISTHTSQIVSQSHKHLNSSKQKCFRINPNEPFSDTQHAYLHWIMKRVRLENKHMSMNEGFWNMYEIVLKKIGGDVLKSLYDILPSLIENSGESMRNSKNASAKSNKRQLRGKMPAKKKKRDNS